MQRRVFVLMNTMLKIDATTKLRWLILATLLVNAAPMLSPIINEGDSITYAALSQHIANSGDWMSLVLEGKDWLDKPHFPFWITALFFKIGGISAFTYILPGYLFHLLGGYFAYRIARQFYDRSTALLTLLVYVSVYHLMYTSSEIKAEAFLTGSITGACYYWLRFDAASKVKHLLLGALFSAVAVMTKGVFTLITIASGLVCMWAYQKQWRKFWSAKWLLAVVVTVLFTAPELIALYLQFDAHPENVVFGRTHVSGIKFFAWDSQFGRFFNFGPITKVEGSPFYYLHVFLWAYLPWVVVFLAALYKGVRGLLGRKLQHAAAFVFLVGSFFVTFALFSATTFQIDYYTVILFPFASILCGHYLKCFFEDTRHAIALPLLQMGVAALVFSLALGVTVYVNQALVSYTAFAFFCVTLLLSFYLRADRKLLLVLVLPVLSINAVFAAFELSAYLACYRYSIPYNMQKYVPGNPDVPVYFYQLDPINAQELSVYTGADGTYIKWLSDIPADTSQYYLVIRSENLEQLSSTIGHFEVLTEGQWVDHKSGLLPRMLRIAKGVEPLEAISVVKVGASRL